MGREFERGTWYCARVTRRRALALMGGSGGALLAGCCGLRRFAPPTILGPTPNVTGTPLKPQVRKSSAAPAFCVDVHAHFFNASDVPVKGYLEGPVAHDLKEPLRSLAKALAPLADSLASIAPTAKDEYAELLDLVEQPRLKSLREPASLLNDLVTRRQADVSQRFYEAVRGSDFERQYNAIQSTKRSRPGASMRAESLEPLGPQSLGRSMSRGSRPDTKKSRALREVEASEPYADGLLAFLGYMLSARWMNLHEYAQAYSASPEAFGVDHTMGALVDFDRWLDCPPRSGHDDQIRLHELLSRLSGRYMLPLAAYNPWSHVVEGEPAIARIVDAVQYRGFVGVKTYPPNGFRPYGNVLEPLVSTPGAPSPADLDAALARFWDVCRDLNVPVMAHTGETMGRDDAHDTLGGPIGWNALFERYKGQAAPRANAGHFGGDGEANNWTESLAALMSRPEGATLYGDLGYWSALRCAVPSGKECTTAQGRLKAALQYSGVNKRVMYGSDWLMLSKEPDWAMYPYDIAEATKGLIAAQDLFGLVAKSCFGSLS